MKTFWTTILLIIVAFTTVIGQSIKITIEKDAFIGLDKSALIISDELGDVLFHYLFTEMEMRNGITLEYFKDTKVKNHHVTLFNGNDGYSWTTNTKARTFYNVSDEVVISKSFLPFDFLDFSDLTIKINGIENFHGIYVSSITSYHETDVKPKPKKELLKILHRHPKNTDLYLVLHGNNETNFRYIYLPKDEVQPQLQFDWEALPSTLKKHSINLNQEEEWTGFIRGVNDETGNECYFFSAFGEDHFKNVEFFIPEDFLFFDYEYFFRRSNSKTSSFDYYAKSDFAPNFPEIVEEDFSYDLKYMDDYSFELSIDHPEAEVQLNTLSDWQIIANNETSINFVFPTVPGTLQLEFPVLKGMENNQLYSIFIIQKNEDGTEISYSEKRVFHKYRRK